MVVTARSKVYSSHEKTTKVAVAAVLYCCTFIDMGVAYSVR
jgi:hypothetical protein